LDLIGYVRSITQAAANIDSGRKGFATRGKAYFPQQFTNLVGKLGIMRLANPLFLGLGY